LFAGLPCVSYVVRRVDERNMGECLGEVANETLSACTRRSNNPSLKRPGTVAQPE